MIRSVSSDPLDRPEHAANATNGSPIHLREPPCFAIESTDVVVIPEVFGPDLAGIAPGVPKVIFVQNPYAAFFGYPTDPRSSYSLTGTRRS